MEFVFKPGAARKKLEEEKKKQEEERTELCIILCNTANAIEALANRQMEQLAKQKAAEEAAAAEKAAEEAAATSSDQPRGLLGGKSTKAKLAAAMKRKIDLVDFADSIPTLNVLLSSEAREVRIAAAVTVAKVAEASLEAKDAICDIGSIAKLVKLMEGGILEGVTAISILTFQHSKACDQVVAAPGAIDLLTTFINTNEDDNNKDDDTDEDSNAGKRKKERNAKDPNEAFERPVLDPADGPRSLADIGSALLPGMTAAKSVVKPLQMIIPVATKTEAVASLRNIATSNDANREVITQRQVIPQLVKLMTKMKIEDDNKSAQSGKSKESAGSGGKGGDKDDEEKPGGLIDRKQLARDNRMLAESAGQMLHTLILEGRSDVKQLIISAIISTVQQPGSVPPEDVPALMTILRSAAEEQLEIVRSGDDNAALQSALEFGRWIKVPAIMLGEARNHFKAKQLERKREMKMMKRRMELGLISPTKQEQQDEYDLYADLDDHEDEGADSPTRDDMMAGAPADAAQASPQRKRRGGGGKSGALASTRGGKSRTAAAAAAAELAERRAHKEAALAAARAQIESYHKQLKKAQTEAAQKRIEAKLRQAQIEGSRLGSMVDEKGRYVGGIGILETPMDSIAAPSAQSSSGKHGKHGKQASSKHSSVIGAVDLLEAATAGGRKVINVESRMMAQGSQPSKAHMSTEARPSSDNAIREAAPLPAASSRGGTNRRSARGPPTGRTSARDSTRMSSRATSDRVPQGRVVIRGDGGGTASPDVHGQPQTGSTWALVRQFTKSSSIQGVNASVSPVSVSSPIRGGSSPPPQDLSWVTGPPSRPISPALRAWPTQSQLAHLSC